VNSFGEILLPMLFWRKNFTLLLNKKPCKLCYAIVVFNTAGRLHNWYACRPYFRNNFVASVDNSNYSLTLHPGSMWRPV